MFQFSFVLQLELHQRGARRDSRCAHIFFGETTNNPHAFSGVRDFAGGSVAFPQSLVSFVGFFAFIIGNPKKKKKQVTIYITCSALVKTLPFLLFSLKSSSKYFARVVS